ncbi:mannan-binding lectin [Gymnodinialimonas sp. 2305UL16-5]|uniref:mannan-binding lectin n=1 Tax=Gymnodinialimonas mytili TaxID=3126503 RepID=UPI00309C04D8
MSRFVFLLAAALTLPGASQAQVAIEAGPIWNQGHADQVCPAIAASRGGSWTGQWWTTIPNEMSVCQIRVARAVEAGPIWNQGHANQVCPAIAASRGGSWTGQWWTTIPNQMSVCEIQ